MYCFFTGLGVISHLAILNDNTNGCIGFLKCSKAGNKSALRRPLKMVAKRKKFQISTDIVNSIANLNASPKNSSGLSVERLETVIFPILIYNLNGCIVLLLLIDNPNGCIGFADSIR
jgi:hypothetical protein